jgi:hypothetical protein
MRKFIVGAAAAAMLAGSTIAQAAPIARSGSAVGEAENASDSTTHLVLGFIGLALIIYVVLQITDNDDKGLPVSP